MTPDEVRMLDNRYAILFIRGERPVMDFKYDILKHPDVRLTTDGQAEPFIHGDPWDAGSSIELVYDPDLVREAFDSAQVIELLDSDYALLSEEDVEKMVAEEAKNGGSK
jgi:type IV secretion system protein VirD4